MPPKYGIPLFSRTCRWSLVVGVLGVAATIGLRMADLIPATAAAAAVALGGFVWAGYEWLDAVTKRWAARRTERRIANREPAPDVESRIIRR